MVGKVYLSVVEQDEDYEEERPPGFGCGRAQKQRLHCTADFHH